MSGPQAEGQQARSLGSRCLGADKLAPALKKPAKMKTRIPQSADPQTNVSNSSKEHLVTLKNPRDNLWPRGANLSY